MSRASRNRKPVAIAAQPVGAAPVKINRALHERLNAMGQDSQEPITLGPPKMRPGVIPEADKLAMDGRMSSVYEYASDGFHGMGFLGYPLLAELAQRSEYRQMSGRLASEMTRKWVKLKSTGDKDKSKQIQQLNEAQKKFNIRELFRECAELDGLFGNAKLFVNINGVVEGPELEKPLALSPAKVAKGSLKGFKVIEPSTTYPSDYNSINPLREDYFTPTMWYVMGQKIHATRLFPFSSRKLPDILKPAYNFGGLSLSQLAKPTVDNWLGTRDSVSALLSNFSTSCYATDLGELLSGGSDSGALDRAQLFTQMRDNLGLMILDKGREEFFQVNTPLSGLDKLQAQAQEHMASVAQIPLVVLTGITPSGLNASSDGEIRVFYDFVKDMQEILFRGPLEDVIKLLQLHLFGEIDEDITFDFEPLFEMDEGEKAKIRKSAADSGIEYIAASVITPLEERKRLAADPDSGYSELDVDADVPVPDPALVLKKDPIEAAVEGIQPAGGGE